jgi:putative oxidoreductase
MKVAVITIRIVLGLLFVVSSLGYFFNLMPAGELSESAQLFFTGMVASKYLLPVVKTIELLVGIAFLAGKFVPLATVVIFPITLNIVLFHAFLAPEGMLVPVIILLGNLFLAFRYRENYQSIVTA